MTPSRSTLHHLAATMLLVGVLGLATALPAAAQTGGQRFDNCAEALAAGRHDILRSDPAWNASLEHSADGVACKLPPRPESVANQAPAPPLPPAGPPIAQSTLTGAIVLIVVAVVVGVLLARRRSERS